MSSRETCKLCFNLISNENFQVIEGTIKDIFDVLLLYLNFDKNVVYVMCKTCFKKIMEAFEFKSTCVYTDATIIPYIDLKTLSRLDLGEIYWKERGDDHTISSWKELKICRLCMQLAGNNFFSLQEMNNDMLQKFFPEINVDIITDPVVCQSCFGLFNSISKFLQNCVDINENTMQFVSLRGDSQGTGSSFDCCTQRDTKLGNVKSECIENEEMTIKTEEIQIKSEVDETYGDQSMFSVEETGTVIMDVEKRGMKISNKRNAIGKFELGKISAHHQEPKSEYENSSKVRLRKHYVYQSNRKRNFCTKYKTEGKIFICYMCGFKALKRKNLQRHFKKHKNACDAQFFNCNICNFKTKYRENFNKHLKLKHELFSEVRIYKCTSCDFKTKYIESLRRHNKRKHSFEVRKYKCDNCDFETSYDGNLRRHNRSKHMSEVRKYKCDSCEYKTIFKYKLHKHQLKHKNHFEIMNKCDKCD